MEADEYIQDGEEALAPRQVWADLNNLTSYKRATRSPLVRQSILCPLCKISVETWQRLSERGRWFCLQDGLEALMAEKVCLEPSPWRAAAYGFLWIRFFWRVSAVEARDVLSDQGAIREALEALLRGKKSAWMWCGMCTDCFRMSRRASTATDSGGR
ncbi:MAG: hypothetical protein JXR84_14630 [Anaerolineae bacterium]|nr:hypothetical protein [Anaerolineae bacterium]